MFLKTPAGVRQFATENEAQAYEVASELSPGYFPRTDGIDPAVPEVRPLSSLSVDPHDDANELLQHRFLCRTGGLLVVGPTGIGKSTFTLQAALSWSAGKPHFGIRPRGPLRCLIVQAENDDGDLVEMRDGVLDAMISVDLFAKAEAQQAADRVLICRDVVSTGPAVGATLGKLLSQYPSDLVFLDPAFSYLGGDAKDSTDVSLFLRQVINPVLLKHNTGIVIVHHTNKPLRGAEKGDWQAGDFAYLGAGSAEWANWARCVLALRSIGSDTVFELRAAKRGKRLGWMDDDGERTTTKFIGHSDGGICWREVAREEVNRTLHQADDAKQHYSEHLTAALEIAMRQVWTVGNYKRELANATGTTADRALVQLVNLVGEQDGIGRGRFNKGCHPVYIIGPRAAVEREIESQAKGEVQGAR